MNKDEFIEELKKIEYDISNDTLSKLEKYYDLLKEWNSKFNLTRIIEKNDVYLKHYFDSLMINKIIDLSKFKSILDIGSGAGFPGLVIAICFPNMKVDLLESNNKKCKFLTIVKESLNLNNVTIIQKRAEDYAKEKREQYDYVTCRAVSHLNTILELAIPLTKIDGYFVPLKSNIDQELKETTDKLVKIGASIVSITEYLLPIEESKRTIIVIKKDKKTNLKYPREYSSIIKDLKKN